MKTIVDEWGDMERAGRAFVDGLVAGIDKGAPHPTDAIASEIRFLYDSTVPGEVQRALDLRQRWARRMRRREARSGTTGRRGARAA